jgi:hypothetical protein
MNWLFSRNSKVGIFSSVKQLRGLVAIVSLIINRNDTIKILNY